MYTTNKTFDLMDTYKRWHQQLYTCIVFKYTGNIYKNSPQAHKAQSSWNSKHVHACTRVHTAVQPTSSATRGGAIRTQQWSGWLPLQTCSAPATALLTQMSFDQNAIKKSKINPRKSLLCLKITTLLNNKLIKSK